MFTGQNTEDLEPLWHSRMNGAAMMTRRDRMCIHYATCRKGVLELTADGLGIEWMDHEPTFMLPTTNQASSRIRNSCIIQKVMNHDGFESSCRAFVQGYPGTWLQVLV